MAATSFKRRERVVNPFSSPFAHNAWLYLTLSMAVVSIVLITVAHGLK
jgi:hypothetical protein